MQTPFILAAMPQLQDPLFSKAVVLVLQNNAEGTFGLIINSPLLGDDQEQAFLSAEIVDQEGSTLSQLEETLLRGGPVDGDAIFILHRDKDLGTEASSVDEGLYLETDPEIFQKILSSNELRQSCRFYLGCSSWAPGQLEGEIRSGSWLPVNYSAALIFQSLTVAPEELRLWKERLWKEAIIFGGADPLTLMAQTSFGQNSAPN